MRGNQNTTTHEKWEKIFSSYERSYRLKDWILIKILVRAKKRVSTTLKNFVISLQRSLKIIKKVLIFLNILDLLTKEERLTKIYLLKVRGCHEERRRIVNKKPSKQILRSTTCMQMENLALRRLEQTINQKCYSLKQTEWMRWGSSN